MEKTFFQGMVGDAHTFQNERILHGIAQIVNAILLVKLGEALKAYPSNPIKAAPDKFYSTFRGEKPLDILSDDEIDFIYEHVNRFVSDNRAISQESRGFLNGYLDQLMRHAETKS